MNQDMEEQHNATRNTQHAAPEGSDQTLCATCRELREEYLQGWKRAQADYQNLKKDTEREKAEFAKYANERLLSDLLPTLDQFALALKHVPASDADRKSWDNWLVGVRAVQSLWEQAAKAQGLERIPTDGAFDPVRHEAVGEEEGDAPGSILRVTQDGWTLHGKIIRPAKVIISK